MCLLRLNTWSEKEGGELTCNDVDARYLLEHLVDVSEDCPVEVAIIVLLEAVGKVAGGHLKGGILDSHEVVVDFWVLFWKIRERGKNL